MIKGDYYHKKILKKILEEGTLDENPRPVYIDRYSYTNYHILHTKRGRIVSYENENGEKQKILLKKENRNFFDNDFHGKNLIKEVCFKILQKDMFKNSY